MKVSGLAMLSCGRGSATTKIRGGKSDKVCIRNFAQIRRICSSRLTTSRRNLVIDWLELHNLRFILFGLTGNARH